MLPPPLLLAQIPQPAAGTVESWMWAAAAVMAMVFLAKNTFFRSPPDHERYAPKGETNDRLEDIENQIADVKRQAALDKDDLARRIDNVPYRTLAMIKDARSLLEQPPHFPPHSNS